MTYQELKSIIARKNLAWQHEESDKKVAVFSVDPGGVRYEATIWKDGSNVIGVDMEAEAANLANWRANYEADSNYAIGIRQYPFSTPDFDFAGDAVSAELTAGQADQAVDYKIDASVFPAGAYINGAVVMTKDAAFGDYAKAQIIDRDNVLGYGANTVLKTYVRKWFLPEGALDIETPYAGLIPAGVYVRVLYTSVGVTNPKVAINYRLHIPL